MNIADVYRVLVEKFGDARVPVLKSDAKDPWIEVSPGAILDVAAFLQSDPRLRFDHLNDLTAVDYCEPDPKKQAKFGHEPHLEVVYHLSSYEHRHAIVVKVNLPRWRDGVAGELPMLDSVSNVWAIADWHEREAYDLLGIEFVGHPNLRRILCPEDWVGHPLRKDYEFPLEYHGIRGK